MEKPFTVAVDSLIQELRTTYADAVSELNAERGTLEEESQGIQAKSDELKLLLPAQAREAQRQADVLLLAGQHEEAQAKRDEQQHAERAPEQLVQRQREIATRLEAIDTEKKAIARRVFQAWLPGLREALVEEQRIMCEALDNAWGGIQTFASETGTIGLPYSLITANLRSDMTAREHGPERATFERSQEWFGGPAPNPWARQGAA
jgi:hypothetical protein